MKKTTCLTLAVILLAALIFSCRIDSEAQKPKIESIVFDRERLVIKIDEETTVKVIAKSDEAKKYEKIEYTSVNEGIIAIREPSNDGFIVKGLRGGSTVITAKSERVTSYFEVVVDDERISAQFISIAQPVIEMFEGERKSTQVSLYGGSVLDNNDFIWKLENGKDNISIDITANIAVISGLQGGHQKIIVSHPKAEYDSEILVFVKANDEVIRYISSQSNVVLVPIDGQYHDFSVNLINGKQEDNINFSYTVTENAGKADIVPNGNICNVRGIAGGSSVIRITHPLAVMDFDIRLIVYDVNIPFIVLDKTFVLLNVSESVNVAANVENARNVAAAINDFSYDVIASKENVIQITQTNNHFYIRGLQGGNARIVISNGQTEISREILVVVRDELIYRDDYYITTSQNVIMTQVGASEVQLNMQLVNGNNADANGFEWVVDDGTVITVESAHGTVRGNRSIINSAFNAIALITPKKPGTAKITISHPKSETTATVMVKVYPKGTFADMPILVGTDGLLKVTGGTGGNSPMTVQLRMVSGDVADVGSLNWSVADTGIATVNPGARGMVNVLSAVSNGITKMIVDGANLEYLHESLVLSGTPEFVSNASVIYVDSVIQKMVTEQTVNIDVKDSQDIYRDSNDFTAIAEDKNILYAVMVKNRLVLQGKEPGETKVIITHPHALNDITMHVRIDSAYINIDKPYYITGPEIVGLVRNTQKTMTVSLVGAGEIEEGRLAWSVDDTSIVNIIANGREGIAIGKLNDRQTRVRISHQKSENEKIILMYVVNNEADLYNKVAIGLQNEHYLLTRGEEKLITLITNASEGQKLGLRWNVKYGNDVIALNASYDSAMIRAIGAGNAEIEITHDDNIVPATVYVSVVEALSGEKVIKGPPLIELVAGESRIISVNHINLNPLEIDNIRWSIDDSTVANIHENGDSAYILGLKKGVTYVNIRQDSIGYKHRVTLVCATTPEELGAMYIMGADTSYHVMNIGDEKNIRLTFGNAGFPEMAKSQIQWTASGDGAVRVIGSGESATVVAMKEGIGKVTVSSNVSFNSSLELTFEVRANKLSLYDFRGHDKIVGIVVGNTKRITMRMYHGDEEITHGYSLLEYENTGENIIGVNMVDNLIDISARAAGQSYITVSHVQVREPARILVYTANTQDELDLYYPIVADKTNFLLQVGESATVRINTIESKDSQYLNEVQWGIENSGIIEAPVFNGKKEAVVKGKSPGQCVIDINRHGTTVERIFITVVSNDAVDMTKYIVTESIIGLVRGGSRDTSIVTNLTSGEINSLVWESGNTDILTVHGNGANAVITANNTPGGICEALVTVSYGSWLKRHILVYVCDTDEQVKNYRAMNIDEQYIRLGRNERLTLPLYFAPNKTSVPTMWIDRYDNKVVRFTALGNGDRLDITTLNEGIAVLEATNTGLSNPNAVVRLYIEVSDRYANTARMPVLKYLTAVKTVYVLNPDEPNIHADLGVNGIGMTVDEMNKVQWAVESGAQYVSIYPNGRDCQVRVNSHGLEGDATIKAYFVDNIVYFKVIVSRSGLLGYPHISGDDVIRVGLGDKNVISYDVSEIAAYDKNLFMVRVLSGSNFVSAAMTGNMLEVEGRATGQALLEITCGNEASPVCRFAKQVIVLVTSTADGLVYLTTRDNFSVVKVDEYKLLSVDMVGYDGAGESGYVWRVDPDTAHIISLESSGRQAQVRGLVAGTGKIIVSHKLVDELYDLVMYVRVSDAAINTPYITTPKNIVSVIEGRSAYIEAELVNGRPEHHNLFQWSTADTNIISVEGAGNQVVVAGKQVGIARVKIHHSIAINTGMEILVIVEKDTTGQGLYITTDSSLIDMKPQETRQVSVRLVGGNPEDIYGFIWSKVNEESTEKNLNGTNKEVVRLVSSADGAYITGVNEGEATIRVTHPRTSYVLDIKVYVKLYSTIRFQQRSVVIDEGKTAHVPVQSPTGITVHYLASEYQGKKIVNVSGTNSMCVIEGIEAGVCIISAFDTRGTMSDEIIVEVRRVENKLIRYIQTPDIIYNMNDWQSALNRTMISGTTVGKKNSGQTFTGVDDARINWRIKGDGNKIIGFGYESAYDIGKTETDEGKMVSIYPRSTGTAEIAITHADMPEYEKTIYVYVMPYNGNFLISPTFLNMQIGQELPVTAEIRNLPVKDYSKVTWSITKNEYNAPGIEIVHISEDNRTVRVRALSEGMCQLRATFNEMDTVECGVFVEKKKSLVIHDENFITILPNEERTIRFTAEPEGWEVKYSTDYNEYLDITYFNYTEGIMRIKGKEREGFTKITFTLDKNGIERMVTVNTNYNYTFYFKGVIENGKLQNVAAVRGRPGEIKTIQYGIFPEADPVRFLEGTNTYGASTIATVIDIDRFACTMTIRLDNCGYAEMEFESDYNREIGLTMIIPVYVYYDKVDLKWVQNGSSSVHQRRFKSHLDDSKNTIYIADNEDLSITYTRIGNTTMPTGYNGANIYFPTGQDGSIGNGVMYVVNGNSRTVTIIGDKREQPEYSMLTYDSLLSVEYAGTITIIYEYFTGGKEPGRFAKTFIVYKEKWSRGL